MHIFFILVTQSKSLTLYFKYSQHSGNWEELVVPRCKRNKCPAGAKYSYLYRKWQSSQIVWNTFKAEKPNWKQRCSRQTNFRWSIWTNFNTMQSFSKFLAVMLQWDKRYLEPIHFKYLDDFFVAKFSRFEYWATNFTRFFSKFLSVLLRTPKKNSMQIYKSYSKLMN